MTNTNKMRLSDGQRAKEGSSVHWPAVNPNAPPDVMPETGLKEPGRLNSTGAPSASPAAKPRILPRYRFCFIF